MQLSVFEKNPQLKAGEHQGFLWKHGNLLKEWKRRFFFTRECALWYYRGDLEVKYVDLTLAKASENKSSENAFAFNIVNSKGSKEFLAESQAEVLEWVFALNSLTQASLQGQEHSSDCRCADCDAKPALWCSVNLGVMLCSECSGVHRSLGSHISRVRSWNMDNLGPVTREVVSKLHQVNSTIWGPTKVSILATPQERETYIRAKYIHKSAFQAVENPNDCLAAAITAKDLATTLRCIHSGADLSSRSPGFLHLAMSAQSQEVAELLQLCGADMSLRNCEGLTVLDAALLSQEPSLVSYVLSVLDSK